MNNQLIPFNAAAAAAAQNAYPPGWAAIQAGAANNVPLDPYRIVAIFEWKKPGYLSKYLIILYPRIFLGASPAILAALGSHRDNATDIALTSGTGVILREFHMHRQSTYMAGIFIQR